MTQIKQINADLIIQKSVQIRPIRPIRVPPSKQACSITALPHSHITAFTQSVQIRPIPVLSVFLPPSRRVPLPHYRILTLPHSPNPFQFVPSVLSVFKQNSPLADKK
jgi:hypothetical protein